MSFQGDEYGKRTLDFVQRLQKLTRYDDICRHVITELEWFGFTHVSSISLPGPGREAAECILMNTRPREYIDRYIEKNYVVRDPVVTELRRTVNPFSWSDVRGRRDLSKSEKAILDEGREFAARDGLTQCFDAEVAGRDCKVSIGAAPLRDATGAVGTILTLRDVTDMRRAHQELARSESRYRHLFEDASDAIMTFDSLGRFPQPRRSDLGCP